MESPTGWAGAALGAASSRDPERLGSAGLSIVQRTIVHPTGLPQVLQKCDKLTLILRENSLTAVLERTIVW